MFLGPLECHEDIYIFLPKTYYATAFNKRTGMDVKSIPSIRTEEIMSVLKKEEAKEGHLVHGTSSRRRTRQRRLSSVHTVTHGRTSVRAKSTKYIDPPALRSGWHINAKCIPAQVANTPALVYTRYAIKRTSRTESGGHRWRHARVVKWG